MDSNLLYEQENTDSKSAFNGSHKQSLSKAQGQPMASSQQRSKARAQVEKDLVSWHQRNQAKIHSKRLDQAEKEKNAGIPKINAFSRYIANTSKKSEPEIVSHKQDNIAETLKNRKRRSTHSNNTSPSVVFKETAENQSGLDIKVDLAKFSVSIPKEPAIIPSCATPKPRHTPHGLDYDSVHLRMKNSYSKPSQALHESYFEMDSDLPTRTNQWNSQRYEKIQREREEKQEQELGNCTFKPLLNTSMSTSMRRNTSKSAADCTYSSLAPSNTKVGYSWGIDMDAFVSKAKPMVDYKAVSKLT